MEVKHELNAQILEVKHDLRGQILDVKHDVAGVIAALRSSTENIETRLASLDDRQTQLELQDVGQIQQLVLDCNDKANGTKNDVMKAE